MLSVSNFLLCNKLSLYMTPKEKKYCVVVIPIHTASPCKMELISFQQCFKVLGNHDIKILAPKGLDLEQYKTVVPDFQVIFIDPVWQSSVEKYNKLKLSQFFYKLFDAYQFMLTYELDAFVFKDELLFWCEKGYDYIGAPWFVGYGSPTSNEFLGVGNSGFSLRNIPAMQNALKTICLQEGMYRPFKTGKKIFVKWFIALNSFLIKFGENHTIQRADNINEDWFITHIIDKEINEFTIAPVKEAICFSFEVKPRYLYELNNNSLPMGCHAWWRYDLDFWEPFVEDFGYRV